MNVFGTCYFVNLAETKSKKKLKKVQFYYHKWINIPQFETQFVNSSFMFNLTHKTPLL
jgi:hypothetical protein